MHTQEIVDVVGTVIEDQDAALALPGGEAALALKEAVATQLAANAAYAPLWDKFRADPQRQKPALVGILQVVLNADTDLARHLEMLLAQYQQAQSTTTTNIHAEGAYVGGRVTVHNGDFVGRNQEKTIITHHGVDPKALAQAFTSIYEQVAQKPDLAPQDKADVQAELREVEQELQKGAQASETFIQRRLRNIQRMAPDILDVVLTTFANPLLGLGMVAKKIADKMKAGADATSQP